MLGVEERLDEQVVGHALEQSVYALQGSLQQLRVLLVAQLAVQVEQQPLVHEVYLEEQRMVAEQQAQDFYGHYLERVVKVL